MDKKLFYVAPEMEVVEVKIEGFLCASPAGGGSKDLDDDDVDDGFGS